MYIIYYGRGALGRAIEKACGEAVSTGRIDGWAQFTGIQTTPLVGYSSADVSSANFDRTIAIYAGRERFFAEMLEFCKEHSIPLINASTNSSLETVPCIPMMRAPNLNPLIVAAMKGLERFYSALDQIAPEITKQGVESHQALKGEKMSGTLKEMGKIIKTTNLTIIRDPFIQERLGIRNLERHGYHWLTFRGFNSEVELTTKVEGADSYGQGAIFFANRFQQRRTCIGGLENRFYSVTEFI